MSAEDEVVEHTHRFAVQWMVWAGDPDHPVAQAARAVAHRAVVELLYGVDYAWWEMHAAVERMLAPTRHKDYLDSTCVPCRVRAMRELEAAEKAEAERQERIAALMAK